MKHQTITLVKFKALSKRLGLPLCWTVGLLESLWLFACHNARDGQLHRFTALELAGWLEYPGDESDLIAALVETRWLDRDHDGLLTIHAWDEHKPNWLKGVDGQSKRKQPSSVPSAELSIEPSAKPSLVPGPVPPNQTKPNPTKTKPSPPLNPSAPDPEPFSADWQAVVDECLELGMGLPDRACEYARNRGCLASEAMAQVEHFKAHPGAWSLGLLYSIIEHLRPDRKVSWPEPPAGYKREVQRVESSKSVETQMAKDRRERAEIEHRKAVEAAELRRLEESCGSVLDKMPRAKVKSLIEKLWPKEAEFRISCLPEKGPPKLGSALRRELLIQLESVASQPSLVLEAPSC